MSDFRFFDADLLAAVTASGQRALALIYLDYLLARVAPDPRAEAPARPALGPFDAERRVWTMADGSEQTVQEYMESLEANRTLKYERQRESPEVASLHGESYQGDLTPLKGKRDGNCNVTACQMPLAGRAQFLIRDTGHYCHRCAARFAEDDRRCRREFRCTLASVEPGDEFVLGYVDSDPASAAS